jgi:hypothetical protein
MNALKNNPTAKRSSEQSPRRTGVIATPHCVQHCPKFPRIPQCRRLQLPKARLAPESGNAENESDSEPRGRRLPDPINHWLYFDGKSKHKIRKRARRRIGAAVGRDTRPHI